MHTTGDSSSSWYFTIFLLFWNLDECAYCKWNEFIYWANKNKRWMEMGFRSEELEDSVKVIYCISKCAAHLTFTGDEIVTPENWGFRSNLDFYWFSYAFFHAFKTKGQHIHLIMIILFSLEIEVSSSHCSYCHSFETRTKSNRIFYWKPNVQFRI